MTTSSKITPLKWADHDKGWIETDTALVYGFTISPYEPNYENRCKQHNLLVVMDELNLVDFWRLGESKFQVHLRKTGK